MQENKDYKIEQLTLLAPKDILANVKNYADDKFDLPLVKITTIGLEENPTLIMLGMEKQKKNVRYYLVIEDNDMSEDRYCNTPDGSDLIEMYDVAVQNILDADQEWLHGGVA